MIVTVREEIIKRYLIMYNLTKNSFCKKALICARTFDKIMRGESVTICVAVKVADFVEMDCLDLIYERLFY